MIVLCCQRNLKSLERWRAKLLEMVVPHQIINSCTEKPSIKEGNNKFEGEEAIDKFLNDYCTFLSTWNQDRCDMWNLEDEQ